MISILMCTYNGEKYLREQLDSILNQDIRTSENAQDYRIYIVDDGSSDRTNEIIDEYVLKHSDIVSRLVVSNHHEGAKNNFFKGLLSQEVREADYVMLSDQDDIWDKDKISTTMKRMKEIERECGDSIPVLVHCDCRVVDQDLNEISPSFTRFANFDQSKATFSHLLVQNFVTGAASMLNKPLLDLITETPGDCMMHDHFIALVAAAFGKISFIDKSLYQYRQHNTNVLSANEGGITKEVRLWRRSDKNRKKEKERVLQMVRDNYLGMKMQAESFLKIYGDKLDSKKLLITNDFVNISSKCGIVRVFTILRHNITCDNWYRVIGECSFYLRNKV